MNSFFNTCHTEKNNKLGYFGSTVNPIGKSKRLTLVQIGIVFISGKHLIMFLLPGYHNVVLYLVFSNCQNVS